MEFDFVVEGTARSLNDVRGGPDATLNSGLQILAKAILSQESSDKSVSGSVSVNNLVSGESLGGEGGDGAIVGADHGVGALGYDHQSTFATILES